MLHLVSEEPRGGVGHVVNRAVLAVHGRLLVVFIKNEMLTVEKGSSGSHQQCKLLRFNIYDACHMSYAEIKNIAQITFPPSNLGMKSVVFIFTTRVHN